MKAVMNIEQFQQFILRFYQKHGRHELPWRQTTDPYLILVSELMLQQTQVERVIPKYLAFVSRFPTIDSVSQAQLSEVLSLWQGLGYNRRAKYLHMLSKEIMTTYQGKFPTTEDELLTLPGIGPYTASAITTFSFNLPTRVIETNIRSVFLYHFFETEHEVTDAQLIPLIDDTIYTPNPREWYWALMDYGSMLKKLLPNPSRKSRHHTKQTQFKGSLRQVRGEILKLLIQFDSLSQTELQSKIVGNKLHFPEALLQLQKENLVKITDSIIELP